MFELDPKLSSLEVKPENILEIYHSLNTAEVASKGFVGEPARAYICIKSADRRRLELLVSFFFPNKNRAIFYPYQSNPFAAGRLEEVKEEAMQFLESFGFILEQAVSQSSSAKDKEYWIARVPLFKMGAPAGEIVLRSSDINFPADGAAQLIISSEVIRDSAGEMVSNGTVIKVGASLGLLGTLESEPQERQITAATSDGMITFLLKAPAKTGQAVITAASEEGSAVGELTLNFVPLDPAGEIILRADHAEPLADGQTLVTIESQPVCDPLGNLVVDGAVFAVEIADRERIFSSVQVLSQKGIIRHSIIAPSDPATKLITAYSEKGSARGELALTFAAAAAAAKEESPPSAPTLFEADEEFSLETPSTGLFSPAPALAEIEVEEPAVETLPASQEYLPPEEKPAPMAAVEEMEAAEPLPSAQEEVSLPPPPAEEPHEEFAFKEDELDSAVEGAWPAIKAEPKISLPSPVKAPVEEAAPLTPPLFPAEEAKLLSKAPAAESKDKTPASSWEPYSELIRFLTRM